MDEADTPVDEGTPMFASRTRVVDIDMAGGNHCRTHTTSLHNPTSPHSPPPAVSSDSTGSTPLRTFAKTPRRVTHHHDEDDSDVESSSGSSTASSNNVLQPAAVPVEN